MNCPSHLHLEKVELAPSAEWTLAFPGWCFLRLREGNGYWLSRTGALELASGDLLALSPSREGYLRASQLGPVTLNYFRFAPELVTGLLSPAEHDSFEKMALQPKHAAKRFAAGNPRGKLFAELCSSEQEGCALQQRCELLRLVATLFAAELVKPAPPETTSLFARQRLKGLMNQISESEFLKLSPTELAARCGCSVAHLNRSFLKLMGASLQRKQQEFRLLKARELLLETTGRIEEVTAEAGYRSVEELNAAFEKQFGVSFDEWRCPASMKAPRRAAPNKAVAI